MPAPESLPAQEKETSRFPVSMLPLRGALPVTTGALLSIQFTNAVVAQVFPA